ncbi:MAG: transcriptional repressor LexA [Coriobacteriales bacterium]|jgi:repressor LexA|nr:transcriptional repressor LexA [Coriobacteriales bacterium]
MPSREALTKRQQEILDFLKHFSAENGYPPSVREIGDAIGLSSSSTVHSHLQALESKGCIKRDASAARALAILDGNDAFGGAFNPHSDRNTVHLPVVGRVAAGEPLYAEQNIDDTFALPTQLVGDTGSFMLTIRGDSMIEAGIYDGDYIVVREQRTANNGDIVVALLGDDATVKTFYREDDRIRLQPENATMSPIYATEVTILGKVIALLRAL